MDSEVLNSSILNMCNLNSTFPEIPHKVISRDSYLDLFEEQFQNTRVLCVDGNEGVGVTTTLALFALRHPYNCISYFNNGFLRSLLMVETIEFNIGRQLKFYVTGNIDKNTEDNILQPNIYRAARKSKRERESFYISFLMALMNYLLKIVISLNNLYHHYSKLKMQDLFFLDK